MGKSPLDYLKELVLLAGRLVEGKVPKAFLIEGVDLTVILSSHEGRYQLAQMASQCETVICCRLLPSQKADVVNVVR